MDMAQQRVKAPGGSSARQRLTARDWADAALAAMGEGGLAAVAVEPLAARLGTTKGSFYWHFSNRDALIEAALERWEEAGTEAVITEVEAEPDPGRRLRLLLWQATTLAATDPLEVSLLASAADPRVAATLARVTDRRIGYVAALFEALGFPGDEARHRGLLAYTAYLGHAQLGHAVPQSLPTDAARDRYLDGVIDTLVRPRNGGDQSELDRT
ncbi:TetR/AcrR family transcriptional regulator [Streptomyces sp. Je 1-4]|uniref:TetR/AcrR family transcriptional regulator n=1 Tax=Streptomyces TaxID=1883 RepID=UPI0021D85F7F|nr:MULTISPECIES: TetR/AcrR family transcriptional regulator [unclassified Streptomyces]UYB38970.1 TetR/AcrR family transcriptional regulator [Streptomyces sp. Je 1-4]UZQ34966.1 TetR/AcrR family transcriptional regulator [Streptomyces sp. Je 1-4] [Streptomyces sp. Je 1-4 4N24]UZQ42384.1 TetR/AcrR family transcriptional regulator [Streptomyces sp. Je 1-4] [Streptomyces sp. Je 1-4 4N24_ara]